MLHQLAPHLGIDRQGSLISVLGKADIPGRPLLIAVSEPDWSVVRTKEEIGAVGRTLDSHLPSIRQVVEDAPHYREKPFVVIVRDAIRAKARRYTQPALLWRNPYGALGLYACAPVIETLSEWVGGFQV